MALSMTERSVSARMGSDCRDELWNDFIRFRGSRYANCRFENYQVTSDKQRESVERVRTHVEGDLVNTTNLLLIGPTGTGKDHLLVSGIFHGLGTRNIAAGRMIGWISGSVLFSDLRSAIATKRDEAGVLSSCLNCDLLVVSDPLEAGQDLTNYQRQVWYRIIDHRYNNYLPVWMSINATGKEQMIQMLGAAIVDRLADGATIVGCDWPSYRRAR